MIKYVLIILSLIMYLHTFAFSQDLNTVLKEKKVKIILKNSQLDSALLNQYDSIPPKSQLMARGLFVSYSDEFFTLYVKETNNTLRISISSITKFNYSTGIRSYTKEGAIAGGAIGGMLGIAFIVNHDDLNSSSSGAINSEFISILVACSILAIGSSIGSFIGSIFKTEKWEEIPLDTFKRGLKPPGRYYPIVRFQFQFRK